MGKIEYLFDTNVIIDFLSGKFSSEASLFVNPIIDIKPNVSVITKIELLGFDCSKETHRILNNFIEDSLVFQLSEEVVNTTISIRKSYKIKLPDAIIAATAIVEKCKLITRNSSDFNKIQNLELVNPYDLQNR